MKSFAVFTAAVAMVSANTAQAAPIIVMAYGQLVQAPTAPGTTPADFAAPIENFSGISAFWIIDPDVDTKVVTPLPAPAVGQTVAFPGSVIAFRASISGATTQPLTIGNTRGARHQSFLIDNATSGGRTSDQFSFSNSAYFNETGLVRGIGTDRYLGEDIFISSLQLSLIESVFSPVIPGLIEGEGFPDIRALIGSAQSKQLTLRFSHGVATSVSELRMLPQMTFNTVNLFIDYIYLGDVETPEPGAIALFGLGLATLALRRRRRA